MLEIAEKDFYLRSNNYVEVGCYLGHIKRLLFFELNCSFLLIILYSYLLHVIYYIFT